MRLEDLGSGFGERLRSERLRLSLTQEYLAERAGVGPQTIHKYEQGKTSPTLAFIYSLQNLGFDLPFLFFGGTSLPKPENYPSHVLKFVAEMVADIEDKFAGGSFSNETRFKMMLTLLAQYVEQPTSFPNISTSEEALGRG